MAPNTAALKPLVSLQDYLDACYLHTVGLVRRPTDPAESLAKAGFARAELEARHAALAAIPDRRCVISRTQCDSLKRALDLIG